MDFILKFTGKNVPIETVSKIIGTIISSKRKVIQKPV